MRTVSQSILVQANSEFAQKLSFSALTFCNTIFLLQI